MATLACVYGQALVAAEEAQSANEADDPVMLANADLVVEQSAGGEEHEGGRLLVFELKRVRPSVPGRLLELAAASVGRSTR